MAMIRINRFFLILTCCMLCFSLLFGGSLPFRIFYGMFFMLLLSYLYIKLAHSVFGIEIRCGETVLTTGSFCSVLTKIKFDMPLPVPYVEIRSDAFTAAGNRYSGFIRSTSWDENIWIRNNIRFYRRGIHSLDNINVKVTDLFHIASFEKSMNTGIQIKVYPRIYKIKSLSPGGMDIYQERTDLKSRSEDQHTIRDVRKYREGDSLKKVHWKLSAKKDELLVKNLDTISGEEIVLFVDMNSKNYSFDDNGAIEENLVDFSVSIVSQMVERNLCIKVFLNTASGRYFEPEDKQGFGRLMDFLLSQESDGTMELYRYIYENIFRLHKMNRIAVVTAELSGSLADVLTRMSDSGYMLSVFYCVDNPESQKYSALLRNAQVECFRFDEFLEA